MVFDEDDEDVRTVLYLRDKLLNNAESQIARDRFVINLVNRIRAARSETRKPSQEAREVGKNVKKSSATRNNRF